jgi:hypothetical protein
MLERIRSLEVQAFRGFPTLELEELADVNLFVGKNNAGKTTVLEAIRVVASSDPRLRLYELLSSREEFSFRSVESSYANIADRGPALSFEGLFYGRPELEAQPRFSITSDRLNYAMSVEHAWLRRETGSEDISFRYVQSEDPQSEPDAVPGLQIHTHHSRILLPFDRFSRVYVRRRALADPDPSIVYVPSTGMTVDEIGRIWDSVTLTDEEDDVIKALRIIVPTLEKLVMVQSPEGRSRMLMAKLREFRTPMPFKSLGEGANHLLGIVLAIMKARGGFALFDEIENGVHYSVQSQLWSMVFQQAKKVKTQVFATTHSWDSIEGFHEGGAAHSRVTGALYRLERDEDRVKALRFSVKEISIADRQSIEVR